MLCTDKHALVHHVPVGEYRVLERLPCFDPVFDWACRNYEATPVTCLFCAARAS